MCQMWMHVRLVVGTVHLMFVGIRQPEFRVRSVTEAVVKELLQPFVRLAVALVTRQRRPCVHSADRISSPLIDKMAVTSTEAFLFCALRQSCVRSCRLLHPDAVLDADRHLALTAAATAWKLQLAVREFAPFAARAPQLRLIGVGQCTHDHHATAGLVDCSILRATVRVHDHPRPRIKDKVRRHVTVFFVLLRYGAPLRRLVGGSAGLNVCFLEHHDMSCTLLRFVPMPWSNKHCRVAQWTEIVRTYRNWLSLASEKDPVSDPILPLHSVHDYPGSMIIVLRSQTKQRHAVIRSVRSLASAGRALKYAAATLDEHVSAFRAPVHGQIPVIGRAAVAVRFAGQISVVRRAAAVVVFAADCCRLLLCCRPCPSRADAGPCTRRADVWFVRSCHSAAPMAVPVSWLRCHAVG